MKSRMGYRDSLQWLLDNDDTEFMHTVGDPVSVTLTLVADIFGKDQDDVVSDLARLMIKQGHIVPTAKIKGRKS